MIDFRWEDVGKAVAGLVVGLGTGIALWQRRHANAARLQVEVAQSGAQRTIADAEHTLYSLLAKSVAELKMEVGELRSELGQERKRARELEIHIHHLENLMRKAGMDPPMREFVVG